MVVKTCSFVVALLLSLGILVIPTFAFATSNYGDCTYGELTYGGDCTPAADPTPTPSPTTVGSSAVVGSGPNAPGYVNTNPYGLPTSPTTPSTPPSTPSGSSVVFTQNLEVGSRGAEVLALQKFLNANGFTVAKVGAGSKGKETTLFGALTKAALSKFQKAKKITPAVGYFGPKTRAFVNSN